MRRFKIVCRESKILILKSKSLWPTPTVSRLMTTVFKRRNQNANSVIGNCVPRERSVVGLIPARTRPHPWLK
jgi:hypothetical protein